MQHTRPRLKLVFATAVVALLVDVITKVIAVGVLAPGRRVPLIGDHVWCALTRNAGAAFAWGGAYTVELAVLVGGIIAVLARRSRHVVSTAAAIAVGLVLGGAAGNLADRVFRSPGPLHGAVVDFLAIGWGPIFNAADVCVVVGVAILTWRLLANGPRPTSAASPQAQLETLGHHGQSLRDLQLIVRVGGEIVPADEYP
jgi:signal peptidase II